MKEKSTEALNAQIIELEKTIDKQKHQIHRLQYIIDSIPADIYWKNKEGVWLGVNRTGSDHLKKLGFHYWRQEDVIGKTDHELFDKKTADGFRENDLETMKLDNEIIKREETGNLPSGKKITQLSTKRPLKDKQGNITGIMGCTIDITYLKEIEEELRQAKELAEETERLKLENEFNKNLANLAGQVVHDIRSPLTSLMLIVKSCNDLPENKRIGLREAANSIQDIANNLLNRYKHKAKADESNSLEQPRATLVSARLLQLLSEKKFEYQDINLVLNHDFDKNAHFSFIEVDPTALRRMVSNIINNSIDARAEDKPPKIRVTLKSDEKHIKVMIADNGKGMPAPIIEKIMADVSVSAGKESGHGIGLTQVRETLKRYHGKLSIDSKLNEGTAITLTFPRAHPPRWIAEKIALFEGDTIVILDDDKSIHAAWDTRFEALLKSNPTIQVKHFRDGNEAINFISKMGHEEKQHLFLLTDYELLNQETNGLAVIEKTNSKRAILVTSHYGNEEIRSHIEKIGAKLLPKQLAPEIAITVTAKAASEQSNSEMDTQASKGADLVIVDDNELFANTLADTIFAELVVDCYHNSTDFLKAVPNYQKNIKILLDYQLPDGLSGVDLAEQLYHQGYTRLYLLSGQEFAQGELPTYLHSICKDDIAKLEQVIALKK